MEPKHVLLDFSKTDFSDAKVCDENSLIHRSKMEDFRIIVDRQVEHAISEYHSREDRKCSPKYEHNTISIFASRGAGKTTFLLSALDRMSKWYKDDVVCLKLIDPSMIENGENTFVDIVARIQEKVNLAMECRNDICKNEEERDLKKSVERSYKRLMEGMSFLDGIGKNGKYEDWDDAEFASFQGMEKAISSINIDEAFQDYVFRALRFIGKKCFVVSFDDIDTDFQKGYQILEVVRKYLTTPMIITVLTGDLELYGKLVRKASWDCFDKQFLEKEKDFAHRNVQEFSTMIDQLENQYLVKILKPENRIQLSTLKEYLTESDYQLFVRFDEHDDTQGYLLENCYTKLLKEIGAYKEKSKLDDELRQFMLGMSLRIQIRLLTQIRDLNLMKPGSHDKQKLATGILSVFWNDINQKANNAKALTMFSPVYTIEMLKFLEFTNSIEVGATFLPETADEILNKALFAIGTKYNEQVRKNNHLVFDYWIRISLIALMSDRLWQQKDNNNMGEFLNYSQFKTDSGLAKGVCLMQAFYNSLGPNMPSIPGTIVLETEPFIKSDFGFFLYMLPAFGIEDTTKSRFSYLSVFKLLAVVSDLMRIEDTGDEETDLNRLLAQIYKMGQYRSYSVPKVGPAIRGPELFNVVESNDRIDTGREVDDHFLMDEHETISESEIKIFIKKIRRWKSKEVDVSCQSLNRIFVRFYHTLMSQDSQSYEYPLAEKFGKMVLSLLNAALVEDAMDNGLTGVQMNTLGDIEQTFVYNYLQIISLKSNSKIRFSFFTWLRDCPLLNTFIDPYIASMIEKSSPMSIDTQLARYARLHLRIKTKEYRKQLLDKCQSELKIYEKLVADIQSFIRYRRRMHERGYYERMVSDSSIIQSEFENINARINTIDEELDRIRQKLTPVNVYNIHVSIENSLDDLEKALHKAMMKRFEINSTIRGVNRQIDMLDHVIRNFGLQGDYEEYRKRANDKWKNTSAFLYLLNSYPIYNNPDVSNTE